MSGRIVPFRNRRTPAPPDGAPARGLTATRASGRPPAPSGAGSRGTAPPDSQSLPAARFRTLFAPHLASAYSMARYLCRDAALAEDIAQEALFKAFRGFDGYRGGDAKAWLLAIVRNTWLDQARSRQAHAFIEAPSEVAEAAPDPAPDAETRLIRQGDVEALRSAIGAIPEPFREALVLRELEELSYKAIAEITAAPLGTVMSRLSRARTLLAERLRPEAAT